MYTSSGSTCSPRFPDPHVFPSFFRGQAVLSEKSAEIKRISVGNSSAERKSVKGLPLCNHPISDGFLENITYMNLLRRSCSIDCLLLSLFKQKSTRLDLLSIPQSGGEPSKRLGGCCRCCCFSHSSLYCLPTRKNYFTRWPNPLVVC